MITENFIASQSWLSQSPWRSTLIKCHLIHKAVIDCCHAWRARQEKRTGDHSTEGMKAWPGHASRNDSHSPGSRHVPAISSSCRDVSMGSVV